MGKGPARPFPEEGWPAEKHPSSLLTGETQIKTETELRLTPVRKRREAGNAGADAEKASKPSYTVGRTVRQHSHYGKQCCGDFP